MKYTLITFLLLVTALLPITADVPYTGRSYIKTEHFQIIFENQDLEHALEIAQFADEVLKKISAFLGYFPPERIPVAIAGRTAQANGYYSPAPHSITLFITSPSDRFLGSRTSDWLYSLFVHELIHYVHLTEPGGPARFLAPIFGPDIKAMNTAFMPGWWLEGATTYGETEFAPGGRGEDPRFEMLWKAPILEGNMWSLGQSAYQSVYPPRGRIYNAGYLFTDYLIDRFGPGIFSAVNRRFVGFPFFGISYTIRKVTGYSGRYLFTDMVEQLRARTEDTMSVEPGIQFSPTRFGDYYLPRPTSLGWIGWYSELGSVSSIARYVGNGERPEKLFPVSLTDSVSMDAAFDGRTAAAASAWTDRTHSASSPATSVSYSDLYLINLETGDYRQVTNRQRLYQPAIHPDGREAAALQRIGTRYRLVRVDLLTGLIDVLYEPIRGSVYEPSFSRDGSAIAAVEVIDGRASILYVKKDGTGTPLWPHGDESIYSPRFLPDGSILFSSDRAGSLALYRYSIEDSTTELVLRDPVGVIGGDILDGKLVYSTYRSTGHVLRQVDLEDISAVITDTPKEPSPVSLPQREFVEYVPKPYYDIPRFGLWLPIPFVDGNGKLAPGALVMLNGVLGIHSVSASAGWSISAGVPMLQLGYTYSPGWGTVSVAGELNISSIPQRFVSTSLRLPLWEAPGLQDTRLFSSSFLAGYLTGGTSEDLFLVSQGIYQGWGLQPRGAFYGGNSMSLIGGAEIRHSFSDCQLSLFPFLRTAGQVLLPWANHVIRVEADGFSSAVSTFSSDSLILLPKGNPSWVPPTEMQVYAKVRGTLMYRLPLANLDIPILFGGLIGAGTTIFAQSAAYFGPGGIAWEEDVYAGVEVSADFASGALSRLRPSAGITVGLLSGKRKFYVDMNVSSLMVSSGIEVQSRNLKP